MQRRRGHPPPRGEPVLDRAFTLLGAFSEQHSSLNLTGIATASGLPLSTARRLAVKLVELGALERSPEGRYTVGVRLWEIASLAPRGLGLRDAARPFMEDLHEVTQHHVLLAVRDGDDALLVERLSGRAAVRILYRVGGRLPLCSTGVGLVLLADADRNVQESALGRAGTLAEQTDLRRVLADTRRDGSLIFRSGAPWSVVSVAAPVRHTAGAAVAALSIIVPETDSAPHHLRAAVRAAARGIARRLEPAG